MAEELKIIVTADTRQATAGMKRVTTSAKVAMAAIGAAAIAIGTKAVKAANDFGRAMAEVSTITDDTEAQTAQLTERVKEMSVAMGVDAAETARGLYQTISAGVTDSEEAMKLLAVATKASIGGLTSQETAVDALTTVINAYGLSVDQADEVADTFFTTVKLGKTRFDELAGTIGRVVPIAATAGISFEEVGAALVGMTKQGISTDIASTALRATLTSMLSPTEKVKKVAKDLGIELGLQALKGKGLKGMLEILSQLYKKNSEKVIELFPNVRALTGVLALSGEASETFGEAMAEMGDKTGAANTAFEKMNKSAARQFDIFSAKLNVTMIELGGAILPSLIEVMDKLGPSMEGIGKVIADNKELWIGMATGIGMVAEGAIGLLNILNEVGKFLEKIPLTAPWWVKVIGGRVGVQDIGGEDIRARAAARGITAGGVGSAVTINMGSTYVQTEDPRERLAEGAFSERVAS